MSSKKGFGFERLIAKKLSKWWTDNKRDDIFWRTSGSGGRATIRSRQGKQTSGGYGDLMALDEIGKPFENYFLLELKCGYSRDVDILDFIDKKNKKCILLDWWFKSEEEKKEAGRDQVLLILRRNRKHETIFMERNFFNFLEANQGAYTKSRFMGMDFELEKMVLHLCCVKLDGFLDWISGEDMLELIKGY